VINLIVRPALELGPAAAWLAGAAAVAVVAFVIYIGIALAAILVTKDADRLQVLSRTLSELVRIFLDRDR